MRNLLQLKESNNLITGNSISFIDIDETTFHTFAKIGVYKDGKKIKTLNNQEFNTYTLQDGESFNFDEFQDSKVFNKTSKPIKEMVKKIKKLIDCIKLYDKPEKVIFLTARSDFNNKELFLKTFRENGIDVDIPNVYIERSGNLQHIKSVADRKKTIILKYLKTGEFSAVRMYDDDNKNLETFVELGKEINSGKYGILKLVKERFPRVNKILFFPLKVKEDGKVVKLTESVIMERLFPELDTKFKSINDKIYDDCLSVTKNEDGLANSYTKWLCNLLLSEKASLNQVFTNGLKATPKIYFDLHKKYRQAKKVKDIMDYKSYDEFIEDVERVYKSGYKSKKERDIEAKKGAEVIYDKNNIKVLNIVSRLAATKYGKGTNWCTKYLANELNFSRYVNKDKNYLWYIFDLNNDKRFGVSIEVNKKNSYMHIIIYDEYNKDFFEYKIDGTEKEYENGKAIFLIYEKYLDICKLIVELAKEKINYNNVKESLNEDLSTKVVKKRVIPTFVNKTEEETRNGLKNRLNKTQYKVFFDYYDNGLSLEELSKKYKIQPEKIKSFIVNLRDRISSYDPEKPLNPNIDQQTGRYKKGSTPWNKGVFGYMGANKTSFTKDDVKPAAIGSPRQGKGQLVTTTDETRPTKSYNGKIYNNHKSMSYPKWLLKKKGIDVPEGSVVWHKDGDYTNNDLDNLEVISRAEALRRNRLIK